MDPLSDNFPYYTPYQFAGNKPIEAIDLDGMEELSNKVVNNVRFIILQNVSFKAIIRNAQNSLTTEMKKADQKAQTDYMINAQQYEAKPGTNPDYHTATSPQPNYQSQGQNIQGGKVVEGRSSSQSFYIAISKTGAVSSGQGNPPAGSETAFGGGVPIMINGLQYGEKNIWKENTPGGIIKNEAGPVSAENMQWLDQKSSTGYGKQNATDVGKTIVGYNSKNKTWVVVSQQNDVEGMSMDMIKSSLTKAGYDNIMSFDGSSSSTLVKDQTTLTQPADYKNNTAPSGVQLSVPVKK